MKARTTADQSDWLDKLPISAHVNVGCHMLRTATYIYFAAVGMLLVSSSVYALIWLPFLYKIVSPALLVFGLQLAIPSLLITATLLTEATRRSPAIVISRQGFSDNRSGLDVHWTDIKSLQFIGLGFEGRAGVTLRVRDEKLIPPQGWRMPFPPLATRSNEIHCPLLGLDVHRTYLAELMAALVKQAGGVVRSKYAPDLGWRDWWKQLFAQLRR